MTTPARHNHRAEVEADLLRGLAVDAKGLRDTEAHARWLRDHLDSRLYHLHEYEGMRITDLASAAGISRETAYKAIDRYRASIPPKRP